MRPAVLPILVASAGFLCADESLFREEFSGRLADGWTWLREHPEYRRLSASGLEIRVEPGNMWGPPNDAKNILLRPLPSLGPGQSLEISVTVQNQPTGQYEQADLVWYLNDGHMVKLGQELVDGKRSIVMGREERDKTRTIAILPLTADKVSLRLVVTQGKIRGQYLPDGQEKWSDAGECDLPTAPEKLPPQASLQCYQGQAGTEHWVRLTAFQIRNVPTKH